MKNPFRFEPADVLINDSVEREAVTKAQMDQFLIFVHDRVCRKYDEAV